MWLAADFDAVYARANRVGGRPMLAGRSADDAAALYRVRQEFYRHAHLALDTTRMTVDAVVSRIVRHLRDRERSARGEARWRRAALRKACPPASASAGRRMPSSRVPAPQGHV